MIKTLFISGMITIPFSGITGLRYFGEVQHELSTYFFLAAISIGVLSIVMQPRSAGAQLNTMLKSQHLTVIALTAVGIIIFSFFYNILSITTDISHGRHAIEKFISSFALIVYCFALAYLTFYVAGRAWERTVYMPIAISAALCVLFSIFEILSRHFGIATGVYIILDGIIHGGFPPSVLYKDWDLRVRSLAFEPPAFGNYAGFAWPWLMEACFNSRGRARFGYIVAWALLTGLVFYSGARTGIILVVGSSFVLAVLRFCYLPSRPYRMGRSISRAITVVLITLTIVAVFSFATNFQQYEASVISGSSISDMSRLASIETAFNIFFDTPFFGVGLGQYGFYLNRYVPEWGHLSFEMSTWLTYPDLWPASYSIYARLAAELGIFGLAAWIGLWFFLARKVLIVSRNYQKVTGVVPAVANPLIASFFCVLFSGLSTDTFRTPMIWITLGLCCRYLDEAQVYISNRIRNRRQLNGLGTQLGPN